MNIDFRVFAGQCYDGKMQMKDDLLRSMDAQGIDMALVCPFKPVFYDLNKANQYVAEAAARHADRLLFAARVDPWQPTAADQLTQMIQKFGARALFLHPWEENFRVDMEPVHWLMRIARDSQIPVIIAAGYPWVSEALQILSVSLRWQGTPIVMTNGGQINISGLGQADATLALSQSPDLYIDTAGIYRQDFIEETVAVFGAERVLFGSGAPYFDQRYEIKRLQVAKVTEEQRELMLCGNAKRLLKVN